MVRVAPADVFELERPPADLDGRGLGERPVGRIDDDLDEVGGEVGLLAGDLGLAPLACPFHERHAALVAPDRRGPEERVAEGAETRRNRIQ